MKNYYCFGSLVLGLGLEEVFLTWLPVVLFLIDLDGASFFLIKFQMQQTGLNIQITSVGLLPLPSSQSSLLKILKLDWVYTIFDIISTMQGQESTQFVNLKILDFIQLNPSTILNIFLDNSQSRLYVSREQYSEIYEIRSDQARGVVMQQIAELEPSTYFLHVGGVMALFKPLQLKVLRNGKWEWHSFTTQLLSIRVCGQTVYSFHQKQVIAWDFDEEDFSFKYLAETRTPFHIDADGSIVGLGKKVRHISKGSKLLRCEVIENKWIFVGDDKGGLHVYDWKFLSHVKSFHEHEGPILSIKVSPNEETVYFSGSDSRICMIRLVGNEWKLGEKTRGQSHDVLSLQLFDDYLISGGITTDFCFYPLQKGQFQGSFFHRVSYCGVNRISSESKYAVVNHRNRFQIWEIGSNLYHTNLLVRYEMPQNKFIVDCKLYKQEIEEGTYLLLIITDEDTVGWKFSPEKGLVKYITIQNQYDLVELLPKHSFLGIRSDGLVEKVSCLDGKIEELAYSQVNLPTQIQYLGSGLVLIGSKITRMLNILNIRTKEIVKHWNFKNTYTYIDHLDHKQLIVQYFDNPVLWSFDLQTEKESEIAKLPVSLIRFGGWLSSLSNIREKQIKTQIKKYWYGVSEGKVLVIPNIQKEGKKKVRVRQIERIAQVIRPTMRSLGCNLAVVPYNFSRMISELPIKPIFTKKIV